MEQAVLLKSGIDMLSPAELKCFLDNSTEVIEKQISTILFIYFIYQLQNTQNVPYLNKIIQQIQKMNNNISQIIAARETNINSDQDDDEDIDINQEVKSIKMDDLPSIIISCISSFLPFTDTLSFETCNRAIFVGTRSPTTLQILPFNYTTKLLNHCKRSRNNIYHWNRFKSINTLQIRVKDCFENDEEDTYDIIADRQYLLNELPIWRNLKNLTIVGSSYEHMGDFSNDLELWQLPQLETVQIGDGIDPRIIFDNAPLLKNVCVKDLSNCNALHNIKWPEQLNVLQLISNIDEIDQMAVLSPDVCQGLQSLHVPTNMRFTEEYKLDGLHELCLANIDDLNKQKLTKLQRIHVGIPSYVNNIDGDFEKSIQSLLSLQTLKYICFSTEDENVTKSTIFKMMRNAMENDSRHAIKVRIKEISEDYADIDEYEETAAYEELLKLINVLNKRTKRFIIECNMDTARKENKLIELLKNNWNERGNYFFMESSKISTEFDGYMMFSFVIGSKDCDIQHYQQKWLMPCSRCE